MTAQEILSKIVIHLRTQGKKSGRYREPDGEFVCMYLAPDGCQCAAGCLIPPEDYQPEFEGASVTNDAWQHLAEFAEVFGDGPSKVAFYFAAKFSEHLELIRGLQDIHDRYQVEDWEDRFAKLAQEHALTLPEKGSISNC